MTTRPDVLEAIVGATRRIVAVREAACPLNTLAERAMQGDGARGSEGVEGTIAGGARFRHAIARPDRINVIAECKRRSPSRGVLRADYDPAAIARSYERAGAAALSVLTEPTFFDGSVGHLEAVRHASALPVLRKDFIVSEYQLHEARAAGADAVLLIVAALGQPDLARLVARAADLGLASLVEVHSEGELDRALEAGASIVGVNNRDLRTLDVDLFVSHALVSRMPAGVVRVAESGLRTADDLHALKGAGYDAFLVGERFMIMPDPGAALREMLETASLKRA